MNKIIVYLSGKKTYLIGSVGTILTLLANQGVWFNIHTTWYQVVMILLFGGGVGAIRAAIKKSGK